MPLVQVTPDVLVRGFICTYRDMFEVVVDAFYSPGEVVVFRMEKNGERMVVWLDDLTYDRKEYEENRAWKQSVRDAKNAREDRFGPSDPDLFDDGECYVEC